jgi:hypothetical protein
MTRKLAQMVVLLTPLLLLLVGLVRAWPQDDSELRQLLLHPEGCALPCWQGIEPHSTSGIVALDQVSALEPVHEVGSNDLEAAVGQIFWRWEAQSLDTLRPTDRDRAYIWLENGIVNNIYLPGFRSFAEVYLLLGRPDKILIFRDSMFSGLNVFYLAVYPNEVYLGAVIPCEARPMDLWQARSTLYLGQQPEVMGVTTWNVPWDELRGWLPDYLC